MNTKYFNNNYDWTLDEKMYIKNKDYYKPDWTPPRMKKGLLKKDVYKSKCEYYDEWRQNMLDADDYIMKKLVNPTDRKEWFNLYTEQLEIWRNNIHKDHKNNTKKYRWWSSIKD